MDTEKSTDSDIQAVVNAISGGDNVAAQASFDQIMQTKRDAALDVKKAELAAAVFVAPEEAVEEPTEEEE